MTQVQGESRTKMADRTGRYPYSPIRQYALFVGTLLSLWPVSCSRSARVPVTLSNPTRGVSLQVQTKKVSAPSLTHPPIPTKSDPLPAEAPEATPDLPNTIQRGWQELVLEGFESALVYYQPGAPKWVITHGAGGRAEWHCENYRQILGGSTTLICPRGKRRHVSDPSRGYYYPDHLSLEREVYAAISTFEARFEPRAPQEKYIYSGYSQGATMGLLAFSNSGDTFSYLVLVEGGYADVSFGLATKFHTSGGIGVLYICGTTRCRDQSRAAVVQFKRAKLAAESHWVKGAGHRPDGPINKALVSALPVVLSTDPRWNGVTLEAPTEILDGNG
jgi:predicted esterase